MDPDRYLEAILNLPEIFRPIVSRDGRWVAWTWFQKHPSAEVYAVPTDGSRTPVRLTHSDEDSYLVSWSPGGEAVLVAQDAGGNERYQLFRVDLDTPGVMLALTAPAPNYFLRGGQLHPNMRWLIFGANYDFERGQETELTSVFRRDLESGQTVILAQPQRPCYHSISLNQAGTHILYNRKDRNPAGQQIWMVDIEGEEDREILNFGERIKTSASWFPDGERVLVIAEADSHRRLGIWSRTNGETHWLLDDVSRNIERAWVPPNCDTIVVQAVQQARTRVSLIDSHSGHERTLPDSHLTRIPLAPSGVNEWLALIFSSQQPDDLVGMDLMDPQPTAGASLTRIWEHTPLRPDDLVPAEVFHWKGRDNLAIQGWLYRASGEALGTIIDVHGGPSYHRQDRIDSQIQFLLSRGFNVLDPHYRGSTGFGLPFKEAIKTHGWGAEEQEDIRAGILALIEAGIAEPGRVGITGVSYGGYSAWCAATRYPPEQIAAAAPVCGMTDLIVDYETTRPDLRPLSEEMIGGSPEEIPERYRDRSPIHFVNQIQARLLIVQGMRDPNVTPANVRDVRAALDSAGVCYDLLAFEDEGHGILKPHNLRLLYTRLAEFFRDAFTEL